jgi:hypothetical protein
MPAPGEGNGVGTDGGQYSEYRSAPHGGTVCVLGRLSYEVEVSVQPS